MRDSVAGAVVGSVITGIVSFAIFFLGNFSTQATLEKSTVKTLSEYFGSVDKDMSYKEALQTVYEENKNAKNEITELQEQLNGFQNQITELTSTNNINKVIEDATEYWNNKDYTQALTILKNSKSLSKDIEILYKQFSNEYCLFLLQESDILLSEREYEKAIEILKTGSALVSNNKEINDKINIINNRSFALLSNLTPVSGKIEDIWKSGKKDNYGNSYTSGICLHQDYSSAAHVVYSLDKKYNILTGKFVLDEESKNTTGNYVLYAYSLENDNKVLIYESPVLSTATRPINVEIDVSNVMDLVLEVYDANKNSNNANTGFVDAKLE